MHVCQKKYFVLSFSYAHTPYTSQNQIGMKLFDSVSRTQLTGTCANINYISVHLISTKRLVEGSPPLALEHLKNHLKNGICLVLFDY